MPSVFLPDVEANCPVESRKSTNLEMLVEVLIHILQKYALTAQVVLPRKDRARLLLPVSGCFVNMVYATLSAPTALLDPRSEAYAVDPKQSPFMQQLSVAKEEWNVADFTHIIDLDWKQGMQFFFCAFHPSSWIGALYFKTFLNSPNPNPNSNYFSEIGFSSEGDGCKVNFLRHPSVRQALEGAHSAWCANKKKEEKQV